MVNLIDYCKNQSHFKIIVVLLTYKDGYIEENESVVTYFDENIALSKNISGKEISEKAHSFAKAVGNIIIKHKINIICAENFHVGLPAAYSLLLNMVTGLHKIPLILRLHSFAATDLQVELINQLMWNKIS